LDTPNRRLDPRFRGRNPEEWARDGVTAGFTDENAPLPLDHAPLWQSTTKIPSLAGRSICRNSPAGARRADQFAAFEEQIPPIPTGERISEGSCWFPIGYIAVSGRDEFLDHFQALSTIELLR
jgi:hypothetical protein